MRAWDARAWGVKSEVPWLLAKTGDTGGGGARMAEAV